jgi:hypothetical protein
MITVSMALRYELRDLSITARYIRALKELAAKVTIILGSIPAITQTSMSFEESLMVLTSRKNNIFSSKVATLEGRTGISG